MSSFFVCMFVCLFTSFLFIYHSQSVDDGDTCSLKSKGSDATSTINITCGNGTTVTIDTETISHGVQVWGNSFEKLLEDAAGLHTFAEFLKKEFSAENIYFWTACERYKKVTDHGERAKEANEIFSKHLATGASEPVNVDSKARTFAQDGLNYAKPDLFLQVSLSCCCCYFAVDGLFEPFIEYISVHVHVINVLWPFFSSHASFRHKSKFST